jgi:aryl-alcohol dehydrogenase-like predicted oxidoreductase
MKIALGTVQFGSSYGVANKNGQVPKKEVEKILKYAKDSSIDFLDTAIGYGDSEQRLGSIGVKDWNIVTKLPEIPLECNEVEAWVKRRFISSLKRLNVKHIKGLMLHRPMQLLEPIGEDIWSAMQEIKKNGLVDKVGFSIYDSKELDLVWGDFKPDIIQVPLNILDQRLLEDGYISKFKKYNVEVHVRSVFLQGLLLMPLKIIPPWFEPIMETLILFHKEAEKRNISALQLALSFVQSINEIDKVVVGVDTLKQLYEVVEASSMRVDPVEFSHVSIRNTTFINPTNWRI